MAPRNAECLAVCLAIALLCNAAVASTVSSIPDMQAPVFSLAQLKNPDATTAKLLVEAIQNLGLLAVVPTADDADATRAVTGDDSGTFGVHTTLEQFVRCFSAGHLEGGLLNQVQLRDEKTVRRTLATTTAGGMAQPLPDSVTSACPAFAASAAKLRASVNTVGDAYAKFLDRIVYGAQDGPFATAARSAESLEHFHVFQPLQDETQMTQGTLQGYRKALQQGKQQGALELQASKSADSDADTDLLLPLHSDVGMFLVMTAAEVYDQGSGQRLSPKPSLLLELRDGSIVRPIVPPGSFLILNGEASTLWMPEPSSPSAVKPWVPVHEVGPVEGLDNVPWVRTWFGRMFFPPADSRMQAASDANKASDITFGAYRQHAYEAFSNGRKGASAASRNAVLDTDKATMGCAPTRRRLIDEGSCAADEVFCWMSCMKIPANITCGKEQLQCLNRNDGTRWPQQYLINGSATHCFTCGLQCPTSINPNAAGGQLQPWTLGSAPSGVNVQVKSYTYVSAAKGTTFVPLASTAVPGVLPYPTSNQAVSISGSIELVTYLSNKCTNTSVASALLPRLTFTKNKKPVKAKAVFAYGMRGNCSAPTDLYRNQTAFADSPYNLVWWKSAMTDNKGTLYGAASNPFVVRGPLKNYEVLRSVVLFMPDLPFVACCDMAYTAAPESIYALVDAKAC